MPTGVYKRTEEQKLKTSSSMLGKSTSWLKGRKLSKETRSKMSLSKIGNKSRSGMIDSEILRKKKSLAQTIRWSRTIRATDTRPYLHIKTAKYKNWRSLVFERDNFTCQRCLKNNCYIEAHHIKSYSKHKKLRYVVGNGVTLCRECHKEVHRLLKVNSK